MLQVPCGCGVSTNIAASIDTVVLMIEIEQEDWAEEQGLADGMVCMLNIKFNNLIAEGESVYLAYSVTDIFSNKENKYIPVCSMS
jgi:hypothetical protein